MESMNPAIQLRTFLSIFIIISTLFGLVFIQMEERRLGYSVLVLNKEQRKLSEVKYKKEYSYNKRTRPQQVEKFARTRRDLKKVRPEQVIQLSGVKP